MTMHEYARRQTAALLRRLAFQARQTATLADPDSVHDLRVSIRRLTECLRVFSSFYPPGEAKRVRKQLRKIMKLAAEVRNHDIAIELVEKATEGASLDSPLAQLQHERGSGKDQLVGALRRWRNHDFSRKWRGALNV